MSDVIIGFALLIVVAYMCMLSYKIIDRRTYAVDFYRDTVTAYKVAYIKDKAAKEGLELVYPTKEGMSKLKETVDADLERDTGQD